MGPELRIEIVAKENLKNPLKLQLSVAPDILVIMLSFTQRVMSLLSPLFLAGIAQDQQLSAFIQF